MNRILLGVTGQTLTHTPLGVPSGATYELEDLTYPESQTADRVLASGSADVDDLDLTTSAAAGPNQSNGHRISVTATTGAVVGAPALLVAPDGSRELIEIGAVSAGSYIESVAPIAGTYPSGSRVYGVQLSASVPDGVAADEELFRLRHTLRITWAYTLDGAPQRKPELVEWSRHTAAGDELAGEALLWIGKAYPDAKTRLPDGADFDVIGRLMASEVAGDIRRRNEDPTRFLVGDEGRRLLAARILAHLSDYGWSPGETDPTAWQREAWHRYRAELNGLLVGEPGYGKATTTHDLDLSHGPDRKSRSLFMRP